MRCLIASSKNTAYVLLFAYLKQHLLPAIKGMLSDTFTFQQDSASAHRVPETVKLLSHAMSGLISPDQFHQTARTSTQQITKGGVSCSKVCPK